MQKQCPTCKSVYANVGFVFCPRDGAELVDPKDVPGSVRPLKGGYEKGPYALWRVTTEGDCEGRTTTNLGTFQGFIDDIARELASKSYYSLCFHLVNPELTRKDKEDRDKVKAVSISLDIGSGTWDMTAKDRAATVGNMLEGRPVAVTPGQYYASVMLNFEDEGD